MTLELNLNKEISIETKILLIYTTFKISSTPNTKTC